VNYFKGSLECNEGANAHAQAHTHTNTENKLSLYNEVLQSVQYLTTGRTIGDRSPAKAENFSSTLYVQRNSEAHPASYTTGTWGPFPGVKRDRGATLTTHPI